MPDSEPIAKTIDVFLSYSRRDKAVAERVHHRLVQRGLSCFYDTRSINIGDRWRTKLYRAIKESKTMVLIISNSSLHSQEVQREVSKALNYGTVICPLLVGKIDLEADLCVLVDEYQWLESVDPPTDEQLDLLVEKVAALVGVEQKLPQVTLESPLGGEVWQPNQTYRLAWKIAAAEGTSVQQVGMELLEHGVPVYAFPGKDAPWAGLVRKCLWTVPTSLTPGKYTVRIYAVNNLGHVGACEISSPITIAAPAMSAVSPTAPSPTAAAALVNPIVVAAKSPTTATPSPTPTLKLLEPAKGAKWMLGRTALARIEVSAAEGQGLVFQLLRDGKLVQELAKFSELELRVRLSQSGDVRSAVIPVMIPNSLLVGQYMLRAALQSSENSAGVQAETSLELTLPQMRQLTSWEQDECINQGAGFAVLSAVALAGIALFQQDYPLISATDFHKLDSTKFGKQLWDASWAVLGANAIIIPLIAAAGGVLIAAGSLIWLAETRRWLGGIMMGAAWGGVIGLGLNLLGAERPKPPGSSIPLTSLNRYYELGQLTERERFSNLLKDPLISSADRTPGSLAAKLLQETPSSFGSTTTPQPVPAESGLASKIATDLFDPDNLPPADASSPDTPSTPLAISPELMKLLLSDAPPQSLLERLTQNSLRQPGSLESRWGLGVPGDPVNTKQLSDWLRTTETPVASETQPEPSPPSVPPAPAVETPVTPEPSKRPTSNIHPQLSFSKYLSDSDDDTEEPPWHVQPVTASYSSLLHWILLGSFLGLCSSFNKTE